MKLKYLFIPAVVVFIIFAFAKVPITSKHSYVQQNEKEVQHIVETFFKGFHAQDSSMIKKVVHKEVRMQSIGKNGTGEMILSTQDFSGFLASICSFPETTSFKEDIHRYEVKMDGKMANVWTPYTFYINDAISHCGTNSFQLFKRDGIWKIFYIVDTRDREGCGVKRG
jgi:hypothetical protein